MKKCFPLLLTIFLILLLIQGVANMFALYRDADYVVRDDDGNLYRIQEQLNVIDNQSFYDITISDELNNLYSLSYSGEFNKQSEVISDIRQYKSKGLTCVLPIYKGDKVGELSCINDGQQLNYAYLRQTNNSDLLNIIGEAKREDYVSENWDKKEAIPSKLQDATREISYYPSNLIEGYTFIIWKYRGLYLLKKNSSVVKDYIDHDQYDNTYSALVGKYYVSTNTLENSVKNVYFYNVKDMEKNLVAFPAMLFKTHYYFNGVYDDKLYITDTQNKLQYTVDPEIGKIEKVGDEKSGFVNLDEENKIITTPANEFLAKKVFYEKKEYVKELSAKYGDNIIVHKQRSFYYFLTPDGKFYRSSEHEIDKAELLFQLPNVKDWIIKNGDMMIISDTNIYFFNDRYSLMLLANNPELKYNYNNIIEFYKG